MRVLTIIVLALLTSPAWATAYFVDNCVTVGSDGNNGTAAGTPWLTIAKVNGFSFAAGDTVSFRSSCTWREQLTVPTSGSAGNVITFNSYGAGAQPIITGSNIFNTWSTNAPGAYSFSDGFENGSTSAWTSVTDTGSKLSVTPTGALLGNESLKVTNANTTIAYVSKTFTAMAGTAWYAQFVVKPDAAFTVGASTGTQLQVAEIQNSVWGMIFEVYLINTGGSTMAWKIIRNRPSFTAVTTAATIVPGTTYNVQVFSTGITTTSGTYEMDVNGVNVYSVGSLALNSTQAQYEPDQMQFGTYTSNAGAPAGNLYFDDALINPTAPTGVTNTWTASVATQPNVVYFNGIRGTASPSLVATNSNKAWYWSGGTLYTYGLVSPATTYPGQIEAPQRTYAIQNGQSHISFNNLALSNANTNDLNISAFGAAVTDVTADTITASGAYANGINANTDGNAHNLDTVTIQNCTTHHNGLAGIDTGTPDSTTNSGVIIQRNTVYSNTWRYDSLNKSGIHAYGPATLTNLTIQDNLVYNNGDVLPGFKAGGQQTGHGIYTDTVGTGLVIRRNNVSNNNLGGISIESTSGAAAYNNVAYNNGSPGVSIYAGNLAAANNLVYNNTTYGNKYGVAIWAGSAVASQLTGNLVKNNIASGNTTNLFVQYGGENDGTNGSGNVYQFNNFGAPAANFIQWGAGVFKSTYAAFDTAYGSSTNSISGDPVFANSAANSFWLSKTSPDIDAGTNLGATYQSAMAPWSVWPVPTTLNQNLFGAGWEVGAYAYGAGDAWIGGNGSLTGVASLQ